MPTQKTKFVMSQAQPTGTLSPQTPIPSQKSQEIAPPRSPSSITEGMKRSHQVVGVFLSMGSATASVIAWNSGAPRIRVGRAATGSYRAFALVSDKPTPLRGPAVDYRRPAATVKTKKGPGPFCFVG